MTQNGIINLSDPPTEIRGFRDGEECIVKNWVCVFHKGKNGRFDWIERIYELEPV